MKKKKDAPKEPTEIVSLNQELMSFDIDEISVEELERRLELAVATISIIEADCGVNCGVNCGTNKPEM